MALIYVRSILAIVLCLAGGLACWFGYRGIVGGDWFGVPFGWGFGTALSLMLPILPLIFDRDDPSLAKGVGVPSALIMIALAAAAFGAGLIVNAFAPAYFFGAGIGAVIGASLGHFAFGIDREKRGCPRH